MSYSLELWDLMKKCKGLILDAPRMLFLTLQILGDVLLSFIHSFNVLSVT